MSNKFFNHLKETYEIYGLIAFVISTITLAVLWYINIQTTIKSVKESLEITNSKMEKEVTIRQTLFKHDYHYSQMPMDRHHDSDLVYEIPPHDTLHYKIKREKINQ